MTAVLSIEATHRARYAQAREALWGKPRVVNVLAEEKRMVEEYRREQKARWQQQQDEAEERKRKIEEISRFVVSFQLSAEFEMGAPDRIEVSVDRRRTRMTMEQIARNVLLNHDGITLNDIRAGDRSRRTCAARKDVVESIVRIRPDKKFAEIARFIRRDHTTLLHILGRISKGR